jgi:hypothetical protein
MLDTDYRMMTPAAVADYVTYLANRCKRLEKELSYTRQLLVDANAAKDIHFAPAVFATIDAVLEDR